MVGPLLLMKLDFQVNRASLGIITYVINSEKQSNIFAIKETPMQLSHLTIISKQII